MNTQPWQINVPRPDDFAVVVQTIPQRKAALAATLASVSTSDIPEVFVVSQGPHQSKQQNLISALTTLMLSGKTWGIRLEDDVIVNSYLIENVCRWSALREVNFGAGWLWHSRALADHQTMMAYSESGNWYRDASSLTGCLGVVFYVPMIPFIVMGLQRYWKEERGAQDRSMSRALYVRGLRVYVHQPQLVEHNVAFASSLAPDRAVDMFLHTSGGLFDREWR